jgi:DNA-binding transcriptional LysR family regulator
VHIKDFDLNLIAIFEAVYEERNQSRAAERLGISQPAVSHALTRLRTTMNDHLFHDRAMNPTAMANDLYSQFHIGLNQIRAGVREIDQFDPANSHRHFNIAISYAGGAIYAPKLYARVREEAPNVHLSLRIIDPSTMIPDLLRQKNIDIAICFEHSGDSSLLAEPLEEVTPVLLARQDHPYLSGRALSVEDLWVLEYASVHGEEHYYGDDKQCLVRQLKNDRCVFELPNAIALLVTLLKTDLVSITSPPVAEFGMSHLGLAVHPLPTGLTTLQNFLVWHRSMEWDSANQWLRNHLKAVWCCSR